MPDHITDASIRCPRSKMIEEAIDDLAVMRLARGSEPDRKALRVDDDVDLCRWPGAQSRFTQVASAPAVPLEPLLCRRLAPSW
jgi:hypothetical protein